MAGTKFKMQVASTRMTNWAIPSSCGVLNYSWKPEKGWNYGHQSERLQPKEESHKTPKYLHAPAIVKNNSRPLEGFC